MNEIIEKRILELQEILKKLGLDAALITDRENIIYFAQIEDIEAGSLIVPANGVPTFVCLWLDEKHVRNITGMKVVPYFFPEDNVSQKTAEIIKVMGIKNIKVGFTRYFISLKDFQCLRDTIPGIYFGDISEACYQIRSVKSEREIDYIRKASEMLKEGMKAAIKVAKPGLKETDILAEAEYAMRKAGSEGSSFRMQVLRHDRQLLVHPYAGDYIIGNNEPIVIHIGASYKGYVAKMCRTIFLGDVNEETLRIYDVLVEAQKIAIEALKPEITADEVYNYVYQYIHDRGYEKMFLDIIGYGVGIRQSEFYPVLSKNSSHILKENMIVDVLLPTIYKPKFGGPRITDTILIKNNGCINLTDFNIKAGS
ncbi:MAG TPA: aminopeptidase P family protein [Clostridiales bacterium]|nr:aminopeptidase P family protein [Clostridiales bacterium]